MKTIPLLLLILISGCATSVSGVHTAPDGAFVVSVSARRVVPALLEPMDEALAEARFKCWSDQKRVAVLSQRVERASGIGPSRAATLTFACTSDAS